MKSRITAIIDILGLCLAGSVIKKIVVMKSAWDKIDLYRKIFTQKITGASHKVKVTKSKK